MHRRVLPPIDQREPIVAWVVDDTGIQKKGRHTVEVARQCCGQLGRQDNRLVAVNLSVATHEARLHIAWRVELPEPVVAGPPPAAGEGAFRQVMWCEGVRGWLRSRILTMRVRLA